MKGNPGAGKSVLMKSAVTRMAEMKSGDLILSFFVHGRGTYLQNSPLSTFRALLNSMLKYFPQYLIQLTERFEDYQKRFGSYQEKRWDWAEQELQEFMSKILVHGTQDRPVVIFVDALDEYGEDVAKAMLSYLKALIEDIKDKGARVKICFSSRHYPILGLDTIPAVIVEERSDKDIRLVVQQRLKEIEPKSGRQQLEKEILLKAQGGFQWAMLVTDMVLDGTAKGIKADKIYAKLVSTPEHLDELYTKLLGDATDVEKNQMAKLFQWMLFSKRPLSTQELRDALATDQDMTHKSIAELRSHELWIDPLAQFERRIRHLSKGLVEFQTREIWEQYDPDGEDSDREAQFIHQSVADYVLNRFLKDAHLHHSNSHSQLGAGHYQISRSCLRYLALEDVLHGHQLPRGKLSISFPLLPYVIRFLLDHIHAVEYEGICQFDLLALFHWKQQAEPLKELARLWRVLDPDSTDAPVGWPFVGATALHALVAFRSKSALMALVQENSEGVNNKDSEGNTPLMRAIQEGYQELALALLDWSMERRNSDEKVLAQCASATGHRSRDSGQMIDINAENDDGETPLSIAIYEKAGDVILKLFESGADLRVFENVETLVHYTIHSRDEELISKLINKQVMVPGAIYLLVKALAEKEDAALQRIVSRLLETGWDIRRPTKVDQEAAKAYEGAYDEFSDDEGADDDLFEGDNALLFASRRGQAAIVNLLLSHGFSPAYKNLRGEFPLFVAVKNAHEDVVEILLRKDASWVNMEGVNKESPFTLAVKKGPSHDAITKLLLNTDIVNIDVEDVDYYTPLFWAVKKGYETTVKLLLENGAYVNPRDCFHETPLSEAISSNKKTIVELLLRTGKVGPSLKYTSIESPLHWAAQHGHQEIVRLLLEYEEVDVNFRDPNQRESTPLHRAIDNNHESIVELLLNNGKIDVNSRDGSTRTPLYLAVLQGYDHMVKRLLSTGKVDIGLGTCTGTTPLYLAIENRNEVIVKLLLDTGQIDVNLKDSRWGTPLYSAVRRDDKPIVRALLATGQVDVNLGASGGITPLHVATRNRNEAIVKLLLDTGQVDVSLKDPQGLTPGWWAIQLELHTIVELLESYTGPCSVPDH